MGPAYILSTDLAITLYRLSYHVPFFYLEDVYTTGFVPLLLSPNAPRYIQWGSHYVTDSAHFIKSFTGFNRKSFLFAHVQNIDMYSSVWARICSQDAAEHVEHANKRCNSSGIKLLNTSRAYGHSHCSFSGIPNNNDMVNVTHHPDFDNKK